MATRRIPPASSIRILSVVFFLTIGYLGHATGNDEASIIKSVRQAGYNDVTVTTIKDHHRVRRAIDNIKIDGSTRRKRSTDEPYNLSFDSFGESYTVEVKRIQSVLHPHAVITTFKNGKRTRWEGDHPNCYLAGKVTSHVGTVSMSCHNGLIGGIYTKSHVLHFEEIQDNSSPNHSNLQLVVGRKRNEKSGKSVLDDHEPIDSASSSRVQMLGQRHRRSVPSRNVTIEMQVSTDAEFTKLFETDEIDRRIDLMLLKYNAVQMEYARFDMLNYDVKLVIKAMEFYETNPSWYMVSEKLIDMLNSYCNATKESEPYDHYYLHSGLTMTVLAASHMLLDSSVAMSDVEYALDLYHRLQWRLQTYSVRGTDVTGRAYQSSVCNPRYRCGVDTTLSFTQYTSTAHEMGHNLGMYHDDAGDPPCNGSNTGLMGGYGTGWSTCNRDDFDKLLQSEKGACLFIENVPISNSWLADFELIPHLAGQLYSPDKICEEKYGEGYRFRKYPALGVCQIHSCVNHNPGPLYGQMFKENYFIPGQYCGPSQVCFKYECKNLAEARLYNIQIQQGGWGEWSEWSGCSRTCGRGVNFRRRECNNPIPINQPECDGNQYDAYACNKEPCQDDSPDIDHLKIQRATETCEALILYGIIDDQLYLPTGRVYSSNDDGQCEVYCNPVESYDVPGFTRFGLMPDGTPCDHGLSDADVKDLPRRSGSCSMCIDGLCRRFGCDDRYNGKVYDECGQCGGDNSSCNFIEHFDIEQQPVGTRRTLQLLPEGAYDIYFSFVYSQMKQHFLEVWSEDKCILGSRAGPWVWDTRDKPIQYANTSWYYFFNSQFLYADGPINTSLEIKLFKYKSFNNTGIQSLVSEQAPASVFCAFDDTNEFCGWTYVNWKISDSKSEIDGTGPQTDQTGDFYAYIDPRDLNEGDVAELATNTIAASSNSYCLLFEYHMHGQNVSDLSIGLMSRNDVLWSKHGDQGSEWNCGNVSMMLPKNDRVVFRATIGASIESIIALDSIRLKSVSSCTEADCLAYMTTQQPPTTVKPTPEPEKPANLTLVIVVCFLVLTVVVVVSITVYCRGKRSAELDKPYSVGSKPISNSAPVNTESDTEEGTYNKYTDNNSHYIYATNGDLSIGPKVEFSNDQHSQKLDLGDIMLSNV